jgi:hypothetical protein
LNVDVMQGARKAVAQGLGVTASSSHVKPDTRDAVIEQAQLLITKSALRSFQPNSKWESPFVTAAGVEIVDDSSELDDVEAAALRDREIPLGID